MLILKSLGEGLEKISLGGVQKCTLNLVDCTVFTLLTINRIHNIE